MLLPLYLLLAITLCNVFHPTDEIGSRLAFTVTNFLAAFAMLYIVGARTQLHEHRRTVHTDSACADMRCQAPPCQSWNS